MQVKLFNIPLSDTGGLMDEMNSFLRGHKILDVEQQLIQSDHGGNWCFCVRYIEGALVVGVPSDASRHGTSAKKIDYREVLESSVFSVFSRLRECRKQIAREDGVAAYIIFTDEELSGIARLSEYTTESMVNIKGISAKKVEKYGKRILDLYESLPGSDLTGTSVNNSAE